MKKSFTEVIQPVDVDWTLHLRASHCAKHWRYFEGQDLVAPCLQGAYNQMGFTETKSSIYASS